MYAVKPEKEVTMSTTTTEPTTADVKSDEKNEESSDTTTTGIKQTDNKSMKKVRSKKGITQLIIMTTYEQGMVSIFFC